MLARVLSSKHLPYCLVLGALLSGFPAFAQQQAVPPPLVSPEVQPDRSVTFRLRAPGAQEVKLNVEGSSAVDMKKDEQGVWSFTTPPLEPDLYGYGFSEDGVPRLDPNNSSFKPNLLNPQNVVQVAGSSALPWEVRDVPHGVIHHHFYHSEIVGDQRDYYVYTPPGYDANPGSRTLYPTLYLLHGYSDDASGWSAVGHANIILDNLIAQRKAKPMIVVMPLGYGRVDAVIPRTVKVDNFRANILKFRETLIDEVIPQVEKEYRVEKRREMRAIAGLSMGGAESLLTGLNNLDKFGYVGSFSAGGLGEDYDVLFPKLDQSANKDLKLLWIACGTEDHLIDTNRKFRDMLSAKYVRFTPVETPGMHTWMVWRRNLAAFAPLLF
jgi:enterochelin esterase-like enzyme